MTLFKKLDNINKQDIKKVVQIEGSVYPHHMQYMQDIRSKADLAGYCETTDISVAIGEDWYIIVSSEEVVDLACSGSLSLRTLLSISEGLKAFYGVGNTFSLDARACTSYRLLKCLEKRGTITIHSQKEWDWDGETMCQMVLSYN